MERGRDVTLYREIRKAILSKTRPSQRTSHVDILRWEQEVHRP